MSQRIRLSALIVILLILLLVLMVIPVAGTPPYQLDATAQQASVDAIVNQRLTATAIANEPAVSATAVIPSATVIPTLTLMPSPTFAAVEVVRSSSGAILIDVDMDAYEMYIEAWEQYWRGEFHDAEDIFDDLIDSEPEWAEAYFSRAINHYAREDYDDARDDLAVVSDLYGELDAGTVSWRLSTFVQMGNYQVAIPDGERVVREIPYDTIGLNQLAIAYFNTGAYEEAIETINLSFATDMRVTFNYEIRRDAHQELGLREDRRFDDAMIDGIEETRDGDYEDALEEFENALLRVENTRQVDLNSRLAYWNIALAYYLDGDDRRALDALEAAEEADPLAGDIYGLRSFIQFSSVSISEHIDILTTGIERIPQFPNNYIFRALSYEDDRDDEAALNDRWRFLQLMRAHTLVWESIDPLDDEFSFPVFEGWQHRLLVDAEQGDRLSITASSRNIGQSNVDPMILVLDINGNPLDSNDDMSNSSLDAEISRLRLPADGQYTVIISHSSFNTDGIIEVEMELD